jgi:hypothetical protein
MAIIHNTRHMNYSVIQHDINDKIESYIDKITAAESFDNILQFFYFVIENKYYFKKYYTSLYNSIYDILLSNIVLINNKKFKDKKIITELFYIKMKLE